MWLLTSAGTGAAQTEPDLRIKIIEGEGAVNNIRLHRAKDPVIEVTDSAGRPVKGAAVMFQLPPYGAGGRFPTGLSLTTTTDERGQAVGRALRPNDTPGRFRIRMTASYRGATATSEITEINAETATAGGKSGKKIAILAAIGGAAAGGAVLALRGGKGGSPTSTAPPAAGVVITPGSPSFGPPR